MYHQDGASLVELAVTLSIASVVLALGTPALTDFVLDARRVSRINALVSSIQLARSESAKRVAWVVVCPSADGQACLRTPEAWSEGWLVFANTDRDSPPAVDDQEPILRWERQDPAQGFIYANRRAFTFRPFRIRATNGTVVFCDGRGSEHGRAVIISYTGRPRTWHRRPDGSDLDCPTG